ncbi:hypothetical protein B0H21DRAFT_889327 [Amylocystis lapponica]|nr:hypothetical protein B0H21DRAFT_889327 [Amylocystis lapponica]
MAEPGISQCAASLVAQHDDRSPTRRCPVERCTSSRINAKCDQMMCRKHCIAAGGCSHNDHTPVLDPASCAPALIPLLAPVPFAHVPAPEPAPAPAPAPEQQQWWHEVERNREAARLENMRRIRQHVIVYVWLDDGAEPSVFDLQDGFIWPFLKFDAATLQYGLGFYNIPFYFKIYNMALGAWVTVKEDHVVNVTENECLFVKDRWVSETVDFDKYMRLYLARQRAAVAVKAASNSSQPTYRSPSVESTSSSSLSTHTPRSTPRSRLPILPVPGSSRTTAHSHEEMPTGPSRKRKRSLQAEDVVKKSCRASGVKTEPLDTNDLPENPLLSGSATGDPAQRGISHRSRLVWPRDYHAVDVVEGFEVCDAAKTRREPVKQAFEDYFKVKWNRSTYYDHRKRWDDASQEVRDALLLAGRSDDGLWSVLMSIKTAQAKVFKTPTWARSQED